MGALASSPKVEVPGRRKVDELDRYTKLLVKLLPAKVKKAMKDPPKDSLLTSEKNGGMADLDLFGPQPSKTFPLGKFKLVIMEEDDTFGELEFMNWLLLRALRTQRVGPIDMLPLEDSAIFLDSQTEFENIRSETCLDKVLPQPNHDDWTEMSSESALTRIFFYGVGSPLLSEAADGNIVCDLTDLAGLETRPMWRNYGIEAKFDSTSQRLLWIHPHGEKTCYPPSNNDPAKIKRWERAKHALKTSLAMKATAVDHLLYSHFIVGQNMVNATITHLPVEHPVRRLVTPFLFRTTYVNNRASESLLPEFSMLHRSYGLTYPAMLKMLEASAYNCRSWEPFPALAASLGPQLNAMAQEGRFPYISDGLAFYVVVEKMVAGWVGEAYSGALCPEDDAAAQAFYSDLVQQTAKLAYKLPAGPASREQLVSTVSQFIFCVTAMHELVGAVVEYQRFDGLGFRATKEGTRPDLQAWLISECLLATTSLRTPRLMSRFPNYFRGEEVGRWAAFQAELAALSGRVQEANASAGAAGSKRRWKFKWFDPAMLEVAISC